MYLFDVQCVRNSFEECLLVVLIIPPSYVTKDISQELEDCSLSSRIVLIEGGLTT